MFLWGCYIGMYVWYNLWFPTNFDSDQWECGSVAMMFLRFNQGLIPLSWIIPGWWLTYPSEKSMSSSVGMVIPNIWKNKKCSKPPIRYCCCIFQLSLPPEIKALEEDFQMAFQWNVGTPTVDCWQNQATQWVSCHPIQQAKLAISSRKLG